MPKIDKIQIQHPGAEYFHWAEITSKHPTQYECQHGYRFENEFFGMTQKPPEAGAGRP